MLLLLAGSEILLTGCCTKVGCVAPPANYAEFTGFEMAALDSVSLTALEGNAILEERVATAENGGYESAYFNTVFKPTGSYLLTTLPAGDTFRLTGVEIGYEGCNSCFPVRPASDYYAILKAYRVNGSRQEGHSIRLAKP